MITIFVGTILVTALFSTVRRSPRRWWIQFWLGMMPFIVLIIFLTPLVIDPLFNKFEPLSAHDPQLVSDLERVVDRGGLEIPPAAHVSDEGQRESEICERLRDRARRVEARGRVGHHHCENDAAGNPVRIWPRDGPLRFESCLQRDDRHRARTACGCDPHRLDFAAVDRATFRRVENSRARAIWRRFRFMPSCFCF